MTGKFVVATPNWSPHHHHASLLDGRGLLRRHFYAGRCAKPGVDPSHISLNLPVAAASAFIMRFFPSRYAESARYSLNPIFDNWVLSGLHKGDLLITSYGYANKSMKWAKENGGLAIIDAGNSHPENFWQIVSEEHRRWGIDQTPISRSAYRRWLESAESADWVIGLSHFVTNSFIERGFPAERTFVMPRPVNLDLFQPPIEPRDPKTPLTLICTGGLTLRKGTPYLFEALRLLRKDVPDIRLWVNCSPSPSIKPIMRKFADLPIEWYPHMGHKDLSIHLQKADIFVLPSLEDGLARAATEAMACGLPVILTPNTGAADLVVEGKNGSIVPIRDPLAIRNSVLEWWERIRKGEPISNNFLRDRLSQDAFVSNWDRLLEILHIKT